MTEEWKNVVGYEGFYEVSNQGRVRSVTHKGKRRTVYGKIRAFFIDKDGYATVNLSANGVCKNQKVHRLVANAFIPNPKNYPTINHKDENKENNSVDNLEWCTHKYNLSYGSRPQKVSGENHWKSILTESDVNRIRKEYVYGDINRGAYGLAKKYGVSHSTINHILRGNTWKYLIKEEYHDP